MFFFFSDVALWRTSANTNSQDERVGLQSNENVSLLIQVTLHGVKQRTSLRNNSSLWKIPDFASEDLTCLFWESLSPPLLSYRGDMASNSFRESKRGRHAQANHDVGDFNCSLKELRSLMELRGPEGITRIQECYGDVQGLCTRLKTSPIDGKYAADHPCFVSFCSVFRSGS